MGAVTKLRARSGVGAPRCHRRIGDSELSGVLAEIAQMMGAIGATISLHGMEAEPELLGGCVSDEVQVDCSAVVNGRAVKAFISNGATDPRWVRHEDDGPTVDVLLLPVSSIDGHNPMMVSVLFDNPAPEVCENAERLFARRRPMAIGYFRLWQANRIKERRIIALEAASDVTDFGILLFTSSGALAFANAAASALLDAGAGVRRQRGSIRAIDISDDIKFQVALNHSIAANDAAEFAPDGPRRSPLVRIRRNADRPIVAMVIPAAERAAEPSDIAAMVYLFDPVLDLDRVLKPVCEAFRLSPVEAQMACHLAAGRSIADSAKSLRIQVQTARGYLKSVFLKTDTRRQAELVHLLLTNVFRFRSTVSPHVI